MKHLLEYDDHDVRDLLGDLEKVGQSEKRVFSIWLFVLEFRDDRGNKKGVFLPAAEGQIWSTGNPKEDKALIYTKLENGDFGTREVPNSEDTVSGKPLLKFLTNSSLKSFFGNTSFRNSLSGGLKGLLYDLKRRATEIQNEIYPERTEFSRLMMDRLGVVLLYGREKDIASLTTNRMVEFGLPKLLSDSYAPGAIIADLTKMRGGKPEIYQA